MNNFYKSTTHHFEMFNSLTSKLHNQKIYQYLNQRMHYFYNKNKSIQVSVLQFFQNYYYITGSMNQDVINNKSTDLLTSRQYEIDRIKQNFPQLKKLTFQISKLFMDLISKSKFDLVLIGWTFMGLFFLFTLLFFVCSYNYYNFRFNQTYQTLQIYKVISPELIDTVKQYYFSLYSQIFISSNKNSQLQNNFENLNRIELDDNNQIFQNSLSNNKIKFFGKQKFGGWVKQFLVLLIINIINIFSTIQMINFVQPLDSFIVSINGIMDSQNKLLQSYLDIKGAYLLSKNKKTDPKLIDNLLLLMDQNEVAFNQMVTFDSQILTKYDLDFYNDFYKILIDNVCDQTKFDLDIIQYQSCKKLSNTTMIQEGVITYMNNFQRRLRQVLQDLKVNFTLRYQKQGKYYFINRGFKQIDLTMSYNIKMFKRLIDRILVGYQKGVTILIMLITPQIIGLLMWFHLVKRQKQKLSQLYGSMLMIPPNIIKRVKNMPKISKTILQFQQT